MIPAIKESNQLKQFLGIKEHFPEFYNNIIDHQLPTQQTVTVDPFANKLGQDDGNRKSDLLKFITGGPGVKKNYNESLIKDNSYTDNINKQNTQTVSASQPNFTSSHQKMNSRSNMRYQQK